MRITASESILRKAVVASGLDSSQWNGVQAAFKNRAFFSSRCVYLRSLSVLQRKSAAIADGTLSRSELRRDVREILGREGYSAPEGKAGTLQDMTSKRRLDLIIDTNVRQARGFVRTLQATMPGALAAFPCQELYRQRQRQVPRNWPQRWAAAGGRVYGGGRMIAPTSDPIWTRISAFGNPFPPFDFNSGMNVKPVSRREALRLGAITESEAKSQVESAREHQGETVKAYRTNIATEIEPDQADSFREAFGDQIVIEGNQAKWRDYSIEELAGKRLPGANGLVTVDLDALKGVPGELAPLIPSFIRSGGGESFSGLVFKPEIIDNILKGFSLA